MKKGKFPAVFILLFIGRSLCAQPYADLVAARYHVLFRNADTLAQAERNHLPWITAEALYAHPLEKNLLAANPAFETYDDVFSNVYGISLPLIFIKQWKKPAWKTSFAAIPRLSSDLKNISGSDFQAGTFVLNSFKKSEVLKYKFGVYYNSEYFGFFMLPLAGIDWNISSRVNLFGVLPGSMNFEYKIIPGQVHGGLSFRSITNSFRYENGSYLRIQDNQLKLYCDLYFAKRLVLNMEAGRSLSRKHTTGTQKSNEVILDKESNWLLRFGMAYRLRLDEKNTE